MKQPKTLRSLGTMAIALVFLSSVAVFGQATTPPSGYCTTSHTNMSNNGCINNYGFHFLKVGMDNWTHNVQCNTSTVYRYWNNLGNVFNLSQGGEYTVMMQTASTTYNTAAGAWIDYNQDGTFQSSEYIGTNTTGSSAPTFYNTFTVPCNAKPGQTILRFRCGYNSAVGSGYGCGTVLNNYGETMDYIVTISASGSPSANFSIPDTVYTNSPARFVNSNQVGYISHEWDVLNYGSSPDATSVNYTNSFATPGSYQVRLTSANCQGSAAITKNFNVVNPTSSPAANFVVSKNSAVYDGSNPIYIDYYDLSLYGPTTWEWIMTPDWLNGAPFIWITNNFDQNPSAFFYDVETYDICLVVANSAGVDTLCRSAFIEITPPQAGSKFINVMGQDIGSDRDSGYIYDSGGPNNPYSNNEYREFLIAACGAETITLSFDELNLASGDKLTVYDGNSSSAPQLGSFTGTTLPSDIVGTNGALFLLFTSDASGNAPGFKAHWTSEIPQNGAPMADFAVPDTVYECSGGNEVVFTNLSTGVVKGQASYDWIFDYDPNVSYPSSYADTKDEESPEWTYSIPGNYSVRMILKSCEGYDTAVKSFVMAATSNTPIVDFTTSNRRIKVNETSTFTADGIAACGFTWDIFPTTYEIQNGGTANDRQITVKFTAAGSYTVKLIGTNDNGSSFEEKTNHVDVIDYCTPAVAYPTIADVGITNVEFEDISNQSGSGSAPGYSNFTQMGTTLILGKTYAFTIERQTNVNNVNRRIWIDYNRDGDFDDYNELVASESNSSAYSFNGTITIPGIAEVVTGEARMRVAVGLANTNLPPCGPSQVGEYEDYTVFLMPDDAPPVITINGGDTVIEIHTHYVDPGAIAIDNLEGNISNRIVVDNGIDSTQAGVYFITYDVEDLSGNTATRVIRKVTVVEDLTNPTLSLNGSDPLIWSVRVPFSDPGAIAIDQPLGNNISHLIQASGSVDENVIGDYVITYEVNDSYGNTSTLARTVQVRDTTAPMIVADDTMYIQVGQPFMDPVVASDNFDLSVGLNVVNGTVNSMVVGEYRVEYSAMDASGNAAMNRTILFIVKDLIAPTIHFTPGTDVVIVKVFDNNWESKPGNAVTASDNYYPNANLTRQYSTGFSINKIGTYTITYTAEDQAGNQSQFVRTIHVVDDEKPVVVASPLNLPRWSTYDLNQGVVVVDNYYTPAEFRDNQNGCSVEIIRSNVDFNYPGIYQVVYQATDGSGNLSDETTRLVQISEDGENTGVKGINLENAVKVYPNPNNGQFILEVGVQPETGGIIEIRDIRGVLVRSIPATELNDGSLEINLQGVSAGTYLVRVSTSLGVVTKRITIQ